MKTVSDAYKLLADQAVKVEDSAVSEYIRLQATQLLNDGEDLTDYYLVRQDGRMSFDGGNSATIGVSYGLVHKSKVLVVNLPEEDPAA
jgi:hypothetical protein